MTTTTPGPAAVLKKIPLVASHAQVRDDGQLVTVDVPAGELEALAQLLADSADVRLADVFAAEDAVAAGTAAQPDGGPVTLRLVWGLDADQRYLLVESGIEGERYPSLSDIAPAAFTEECEIYEQFGIRPDTDKPLNRLVLPPHAGADFPRLGHPPAQPPAEVHAPHFVGGEAFEFPVGPVRQVGAESLYYGLVTSGEEVVDLYLFTWHKHRGLEWRLRGRTAREALFIVERMEGLSAVANAWAFAAAAESAAGIEPAGPVLRVRAIALELERLYNHAAALAALCQTTGLSVGQSAAEIALERFLRVNAAAFGHRYLFGAVDVGGPGRAPDLDRLRSDLPGAYGELRRTADALLGTNSFVDRLEATGVISAEQAVRLGLVGPVARASGAVTDARLHHPAPPYLTCRPVLVCRTGGDALARLQVMLGEAAESVRLIGALAETGEVELGRGSPGGSSLEVPAGASGLGWAESSRGESLAWVAFGDDGRITRARLRPGAVRNWRGFDDACRSQNVFTDIPIIEASFWLTVAGIAR